MISLNTPTEFDENWLSIYLLKLKINIYMGENSIECGKMHKNIVTFFKIVFKKYWDVKADLVSYRAIHNLP